MSKQAEAMSDKEQSLKLGWEKIEKKKQYGTREETFKESIKEANEPAETSNEEKVIYPES